MDMHGLHGIVDEFSTGLMHLHDASGILWISREFGIPGWGGEGAAKCRDAIDFMAFCRILAAKVRNSRCDVAHGLHGFYGLVGPSGEIAWKPWISWPLWRSKEVMELHGYAWTPWICG